jgi:hypothetical protein
MLLRLDNDGRYLRKILFMDEETFHVAGKVNRHYLTIWGSKNPHHVTEHIGSSTEVNMWCGIMLDRITGPFLFSGETCLDMLQLFAVSQVEHYHRPKYRVLK